MIKKLIASLALFSALACAAPTRAIEEPLFRFGLLADIQYADKDTSGERHYRTSIDRFADCVADWNEREIEFGVQLGDIIDGQDELAGSRRDLDRVLNVLTELEVPMRHVVGNHCFSVPRGELLVELGLEKSWYAFRRDGWRFLAIDSVDISTNGRAPGSAEYALAEAWMSEHSGPLHPNAKPWNGGLGAQQLAWLANELEAARNASERVVVLSHLPILPASSSPAHVIWNHAEVIRLLEASTACAVFNGHDHAGGYAEQNGIHYLTVPAMCNAEPGTNAHAVVDVYPDRLDVRGQGDVPSRTLWLE